MKKKQPPSIATGFEDLPTDFEDMGWAWWLSDDQRRDAALLAVWGAVVVGGIDNVLYPILVGNRL